MSQGLEGLEAAERVLRELHGAWVEIARQAPAREGAP